MMTYTWTNTTFEISNWSGELVTCFDPFRKPSEDCRGTDCSIEVQITDLLPVTPGVCVHQTPDYTVFRDEYREHRRFRDIWTEREYAVLIEHDAAHKCLYVLSEFCYRVNNEVGLSNHLALERNMGMNSKYILHSSFIATPKGGVLFSAPSGTGKSTQAGLWEKYRNCSVKNGDRSGIWKEDNCWYAGGVPWWGTSEITSDIVIPLKAVVLLSQALENTIVPISGIQKLKLLMKETTINPWNKEMLYRVQNDLIDLCNSVEVVALACRPDEEAVETLANYLGIE